MKILLVSPRPPWPTSRGGNQRTNLLYRALCRIGQVDTLLLCSEASLTSKQLEILERDFRLVGRHQVPGRGTQGLWRLLSSFSATLANSLAHNLGNHHAHFKPASSLVEALENHEAKTGQYDLIVSRYLMPAAQAGALDRHPVIVDVDDLDTQRYRSRETAPGVGMLERMIVRSHARRFEAAEPIALAKADFLWFTNAEDTDQSQGVAHSILPNIPFPHADCTVSVLDENLDSSTILAVCAMNYDVNERAVDQFVRLIWPGILSQRPDARFVIVGSNMSEEQKARWGGFAGVDPVGYVEDLTEAYRQCAFSVTPIFEGGGTKIKVAESLMHGRTCVVTDHAHRGYEGILDHQQALMVASNIDEFVRCCVKLLNAPDQRAAMSQQGAQAVAEHLSFERFAEIVKHSVNYIMPCRSPGVLGTEPERA